MRKASPMDDMFIHGPAFQGLAMLVEAQIFPGQEPLPASATPMPGGGIACHPSPDAAATLPEVKSQAGEPSILPPRQCPPVAKGTCLTAELDALVNPEVFLALPAAFSGLVTLEAWTRPNEDPVPLVVEIGALVDEGKVGEREIGAAPLPAARQGLNLLHPRHLVSLMTCSLGLRR